VIRVDLGSQPVVIGPSSGDVILYGDYYGNLYGSDGADETVVTIKSGYRGTVRLDGVHIDSRWDRLDPGVSTPVLLEPGADCNIELSGKNVLVAGKLRKVDGAREFFSMGGCAAIYVPKGAKLRLSGNGYLLARGGDGAYSGGGGAGIGGRGGNQGISPNQYKRPHEPGEQIRTRTPMAKGEDGHDCGEVTVSSGANVEAYGGNSMLAGGAGIGGGGGGGALGPWENGKGGDGGVLNIFGNVKAAGGNCDRYGGGGSGIGGGGSAGVGGSSNTVNISGNARVYATGGGGDSKGGGGSGIGGGGGCGGLDVGKGGDGLGISISGAAKVRAFGGGAPQHGGSGIGGGGGGYGTGGTSSVHIAGGDVRAVKGGGGGADDIGRGSGDGNTADNPKPSVIIDKNAVIR
jgi:hypothetical protein